MILLTTDTIPDLLARAKKEGLVPRISNPEEFAQRTRVVLLQHEPSGIDIDISLGMLPFEIEMVERSKLHDVGSLSIRLPSPEDLIIMKAVAHRPKDLLDIESIVTRYPQLDRGRIQFWVKQFAKTLEMPELWSDVAQILSRAK